MSGYDYDEENWDYAQNQSTGDPYDGSADSPGSDDDSEPESLPDARKSTAAANRAAVISDPAATWADYVPLGYDAEERTAATGGSDDDSAAGAHAAAPPKTQSLERYRTGRSALLFRSACVHGGRCSAWHAYLAAMRAWVRPRALGVLEALFRDAGRDAEEAAAAAAAADWAPAVVAVGIGALSGGDALAWVRLAFVVEVLAALRHHARATPALCVWDPALAAADAAFVRSLPRAAVWPYADGAARRFGRHAVFYHNPATRRERAARWAAVQRGAVPPQDVLEAALGVRTRSLLDFGPGEVVMQFGQVRTHLARWGAWAQSYANADSEEEPSC